MAVTFYTVLIEPGYPVKYCKPKDSHNGLSYGRVQTFLEKDYPFSDPGDACGEFEAWLGPDVLVCYLELAQFRAKVNALHKLRRDVDKKLKEWSVMVAK